MSAAARRAELETAVKDAVNESHACRKGDGCWCCAANADAALAAADDYAAAVAAETVNRMTPDQLRARLRLAEAAAEADGSAS